MELASIASGLQLTRPPTAKRSVAAKLATDAATEVDDGRPGGRTEPGHRSLAAAFSHRKGRRRNHNASKGRWRWSIRAGVARQMQEAVLHRARRQGGSLLARILALLSLITGRKRRQADPAAYLVDWRRRGSLGHILNPVRAALVGAAGGGSGRHPSGDPQSPGSGRCRDGGHRALDRSTRHAAARADRPHFDPLAVGGLLQLLSGAVLLFAIAWYLAVIFGPGGLLVSTVDVPYLGPVPMPLVLLAGSLALSLLLGFCSPSTPAGSAGEWEQGRNPGSRSGFRVDNDRRLRRPRRGRERPPPSSGGSESESERPGGRSAMIVQS